MRLSYSKLEASSLLYFLVWLIVSEDQQSWPSQAVAALHATFTVTYILDENSVIKNCICIFFFDSSFIPFCCFEIVRRISIEATLVHQSKIIESLRIALFDCFLVVLDSFSLVGPQYSNS